MHRHSKEPFRKERLTDLCITTRQGEFGQRPLTSIWDKEYPYSLGLSFSGYQWDVRLHAEFRRPRGLQPLLQQCLNRPSSAALAAICKLESCGRGGAGRGGAITLLHFGVRHTEGPRHPQATQPLQPYPSYSAHYS